tara:strand:- start:3441 stop:3947 length:507 start_codon:yes stop_codon:yes gene_type:complete
MATAVIADGLADIQVDSGDDNAMERIGYTRNGVDVTFEGYFLNVPGDQNGGDEGPPIEIQHFGETARIRMELTKWEAATVNKIIQRVRGNVTPGTFPTPGTLMIAGSGTFRLLINTVSSPYNFPVAIPRMPTEINRGTRFSTLILEWEAYPIVNVLWNSSASGAAEAE